MTLTLGGTGIGQLLDSLVSPVWDPGAAVHQVAAAL
jgi:hypothetical protein